VKRYSSRSAKTVSISSRAIDELRSKAWIGNVRELEHSIERAVAMAEDQGELRFEELFLDTDGTANIASELPADGMHLPTYINNIERSLVEEALGRSRNQTQAAELLKIEVYQLRHLLDKHGLR
jgi:two-component system response regulator PilR (NtrC family)